MEERFAISGYAPPTSLRGLLREFDQGSRWLTVSGFAMLTQILVSVAGLIVDPSIVTGAPAWMKPLKFGISTTLFSFTMAFIIGRLVKTRRFASILGGVMAVVFVVEIVLIDIQAARHTASHFNTSTPFDNGIYGIMGIGIFIFMLSTALIFLLVCLERFPDRSLGYAIRLSIGLSLAGMATGSLMAIPTPQQLADSNAGRGMPRTGSHTVGGRDGGPGLPVAGWSADHGDLRIAHFVGLHAMQGLLLGWWLTTRRRNWTQTRQIRLIWTIGAASAGVFATVLWQALRGLPILRPDREIAASWCLSLLVAAALLIWTCLPAHAETPSFKGAR
jgi:hypothetical protein